MHFLKYIDKKSNDPRDQNYYIFKCNICGHEEQIFTTSNIRQGNRVCPKCGVLEDVNELEYLTMKKSALESEIKKLSDNLYAISSKLEILNLTKDNQNVNVSNELQGNNKEVAIKT
jgi:DNA-directed RNA polymerase subunit M/transcription elongation factor TFIIS